MEKLRILQNAEELHEKLKHDAKKFKDKMHPYDFFDFILTAHIIKEWIQKDKSLTESTRSKSKEIEENIYWKACREISNGIKHFELKREPKTARGVFGAELNDRYWGLSPNQEYVSFVIMLQGGHSVGPTLFVHEILQMYQKIFAE